MIEALVDNGCPTGYLMVPQTKFNLVDIKSKIIVCLLLIQYEHDAMFVPHLVAAAPLRILGHQVSHLQLLHSQEHQGDGILVAQLLVNGHSNVGIKHSSQLVRTITTRIVQSRYKLE